MDKSKNKEGLSRLAINFIIILLIVIIAGVIFLVVRNIMNNQQQKVFDDSTLDFKISQVKKVDDSTLDVTVKRNEGEGQFVALSFAVDDGSLMEIIRKNFSMPEMQEGNFSLDFVLLNASKVKRISVTPIFIDKDGNEVIGNVKDEYITPNVCSNYCPTGAQCGVNDCGIKCGNGCNSGYLCLNYKCIKQSSGGSGGGGSSGGDDDDTTPTCTDTCASLIKQCGIQTICGQNVNCGTCLSGYVCSLGLCIEEDLCTDTCSSLRYTCGTREICGVNTNCGTCSTEYTCQLNGTCIKDCVPTTCSALSRTCGTVSNGCGGTLNCGSCSTGYSCEGNGTCIKDIIIDCGVVSCKSGEYCSNGVCLLTVPGNTYFVATNGNDNNPGTFAQPWKTWQKPIRTANAGDIVYFRGGVYYTSSMISVEGGYTGNSGTSQNPIRYFNYPGETPILDGINKTSPSSGMAFQDISYIHIKGLTIRNNKQLVENYQEANGFTFTYGKNITLENCVAHSNGVRGFHLAEVESAYILNCDSYDQFDPLSVGYPGGHGNGFLITGRTTGVPNNSTIRLYGCRAWNNSDNGFGSNSGGYEIWENCWSFNNGRAQGDGVGFKPGPAAYLGSGILSRKLINCIAANNVVNGFDENSNEFNYFNYEFDNNFAYNNGVGFITWSFGYNPERVTRKLRNNIAYKNDYNTEWNSGNFPADSYNSWNLPVTLTDADFVSLNVSQLQMPRKGDGSLPDITFGRLVQGSDLIDKGINVGLNYSGSAPDLGAFEYVSTCTPTTCSALSRTCGSVSDGCGGTLNCGTCSSGFTCQSNGTCIKDVVVNCNGVSCKSGEYCSNGVCLLNVTGKTYFVAVNGSDAWSGNFTHPWRTWQKAFTSTSVNAGDLIYFRGGVYPTTVKTGLGIEPTRSGTTNNWIVYMNYPGETPVLDCGDIVKSDIQYTGLRNVGIEFNNIYYVKLVGLTVRNVKQYYDRNFGVGIRVSGGNMILERCTVYNIWGHGFETWFGDKAGDKVYFINCDAYNCNDLISGNPLGSNAGNTGAGFSLWDSSSNALGEVHLYNCRAWNASDQGFQTGASHYVKAVGCWSFENKAYGVGGGTGWKMGWMDYEAKPREMYNNLAACNDGSGFMTNEWWGVDVPATEFYNNLVYKNGLGGNAFGIEISQLESGSSEDELLRVFKNNIAYDNYLGDVFLSQTSTYTHEYNSWDRPVNVTDYDFISLNCNQLYGPRKADGSLPDITFGHLKAGSDLIDKGVYIPGYNCVTAGTHPGENCVEWYGSAPDLGPFESNY